MTKKRLTFMLVAILLTATCLRCPINGIGPLTPTIKADLAIPSSLAGLLTTLPVIAYSVIALLLSKVSEKTTVGKLMLIGVIAMIAGILTRSYLGMTAMFIGTFVIGCGIAVSNVMLPGLVKSYFPEKGGLITGCYSAAMGVGSIVSSAINVPLAASIGWKSALALWAVVLVVCAVLWSRLTDVNVVKAENVETINVAKYPRTWWTIAVMASQAFIFYSVGAWFSSILQDKGYTAEFAGYAYSIFMIFALVGSFTMPVLASTKKSQSKLGLLYGIVFACGLMCITMVEKKLFLALAIGVGGFSCGGGLPFVLALFNVHTKNAADASKLSGFCQSIGYVFAALGPTIFGKIFDVTNNWNIVITAMACVAIFFGISAFFAGKEGIIGEE